MVDPPVEQLPDGRPVRLDDPALNRGHQLGELLAGRGLLPS
jgi:hypothetical protein